MTKKSKTIEQSRLEIVLLATGVLALVTLLGVLIFINLGPRRKAQGARVKGYAVAAWKETPENSDDSKTAELQQSRSFIDSVRRRSPPAPGNGTKELLTLRRRIQLWSAGGQTHEVTKVNTEQCGLEKNEEKVDQASSSDEDVPWNSRTKRLDSLDLTNDAIDNEPPPNIPDRGPL